MSSNVSSRRTVATSVRGARPLREPIAVQKGFATARSFAHTLRVEENRYTRYERAKVEPDLTLLETMCEALDVSADELLGVSAGR
jgi:transcriptional regulator with XRE-family HTH domain